MDYYHHKKNQPFSQQKYVFSYSIPDTPPCPDTIIVKIQGLRSDGIRPHHHAALVVFSTILSACHGDKSCPFLDFTRVGQWTSPANASPETNNAETQKSKGIDDFYWLMFGLSCHNCKVSRKQQIDKKLKGLQKETLSHEQTNNRGKTNDQENMSDKEKKKKCQNRIITE